jgi:hypothetical protein
VVVSLVSFMLLPTDEANDAAADTGKIAPYGGNGIGNGNGDEIGR